MLDAKFPHQLIIQSVSFQNESANSGLEMYTKFQVRWRLLGFPDYWITIQSTTTKIVQIYRHRLSIKTYIGTESSIQDKIMHLYNLDVVILPRCEEKIMFFV